MRNYLSKTPEYERATRILRKAKDTNSDLYVFRIPRMDRMEIKGIPEGKKADRMLIDFPEMFVGVYSQDCPRDWLMEDLEGLCE